MQSSDLTIKIVTVKQNPSTRVTKKEQRGEQSATDAKEYSKVRSIVDCSLIHVRRRGRLGFGVPRAKEHDVQLQEDRDGEQGGRKHAIHAAEEEHEARAATEQHEGRGDEADEQHSGRPGDHVVEESESTSPLERWPRSRPNLIYKMCEITSELCEYVPRR